MSQGSDMDSDPTPLTAEERTLSLRLARLGPRGEPAPALDARILAAAQAAAGSGVSHRRRQRRWPLALGVAASLALAVGVAWRLRPLPEPAPRYRSQAVSARQSLPGPAADAAAMPNHDTSVERNVAAQTAPPAPPSTASRDTPTELPPAPQPDAFPDAGRPATSASAEEAPIVFDAPAPAAPQPPTSPSPADSMAPSRDAQAENAAAKAGEPPQSASPTRERDAGLAADIPADAIAEEDVPPATADAPEVRDAWLQRIRELAAAGNVDDARTSLREFIRRWPDYPLPDDLRALGP